MSKAQNICKVDGCKRKINSLGLCKKHYNVDQRSRNPLKYSFNNLKSNAKRRGKIFTISFDYFCKFAIETNYILSKGITKTGYTIDCIIEELGYAEGNIRSILNPDNVKKQRRKEMILKYDQQSKIAFFKEIKPVDNNDVPF